MNNNRIKVLDLIKGISMIMVILVHYNSAFSDSSSIKAIRCLQMGCQFFFIVSGFLACSSIDKKYRYNNLLNTSKNFYISKIKSIAPAWWLLILVVVIFIPLISTKSGLSIIFAETKNIKPLICTVLFLNGFLSTDFSYMFIGAWFVGTLMILYFISPLIYRLFIKFNNKVLICIITCLVSLSIIFIILVYSKSNNFSFYNKLIYNNSYGHHMFLTQYPCFALGMLLYFQYYEIKAKGTYKKDFVIGLTVLIFAIILFYNPIIDCSYIIGVSLFGISGYYLIRVLLVLDDIHPFTQYFNVLISFGNKSLYIYLLNYYLSHDLILYIKDILYSKGIVSDSYLVYFILLPITIAICYYAGLLYRYIVNNIMHYINNINYQRDYYVE